MVSSVAAIHLKYSSQVCGFIFETFSLINKNHSGSSRYEVSHEAEHDKRKQKGTLTLVAIPFSKERRNLIDEEDIDLFS